jgi:hypothetical protein
MARKISFGNGGSNEEDGPVVVQRFLMHLDLHNQKYKNGAGGYFATLFEILFFKKI